MKIIVDIPANKETCGACKLWFVAMSESRYKCKAFNVYLFSKPKDFVQEPSPLLERCSKCLDSERKFVAMEKTITDLKKGNERSY